MDGWLPGKVRFFYRAGAPGVTNDINSGYQVTDIWVDTTASLAYRCVNNSAGAAVWKEGQDAEKIKGIPVDDSAIGDGKVLSYDLASNSLVYIAPAPSGATIKSIQQGLITMVDANSGSTTINAVVMANSMVLLNGYSGGPGLNYQGFRIQLSNTTTVICNTYGNTTNTACVNFTVIEFDEGCVSVQRGIASPPESYNTYDITITEVDLSKAICNWIGSRTSGGNNPTLGLVRLALLNSTTLRAIRSATTGAWHYSWEVIEFL